MVIIIGMEDIKEKKVEWGFIIGELALGSRETSPSRDLYGDFVKWVGLSQAGGQTVQAEGPHILGKSLFCWSNQRSRVMEPHVAKLWCRGFLSWAPSFLSSLHHSKYSIFMVPGGCLRLLILSVSFSLLRSAAFLTSTPTPFSPADLVSFVPFGSPWVSLMNPKNEGQCMPLLRSFGF